MAVRKVVLCRVPFALHLFGGVFFSVLRKYKLGMDFPDLPLSDGSAPNLLGHIQSSLPASISLPAAPTSVGRDGLSWRVCAVPAAITAPAWDKNQYMRLLERGSCVTSSNYSSWCLWEGGMAPLCKPGTRHLGRTLFISFVNIHRRGITP